jgi:hypothetical protein
VAEGEELGSNLLHVAQSSRGGSGGVLKIGTATGTPRSDLEMTVLDGPTACRAAGRPTPDMSGH